MTDTKKTEDSTPPSGGTLQLNKPLTLKLKPGAGAGAGNVEVKRIRASRPTAGAAAPAMVVASPELSNLVRKPSDELRRDAEPQRNAKSLTNNEREARMRALQSAVRAEDTPAEPDPLRREPRKVERAVEIPVAEVADLEVALDPARPAPMTEEARLAAKGKKKTAFEEEEEERIRASNKRRRSGLRDEETDDPTKYDLYNLSAVKEEALYTAEEEAIRSLMPGVGGEIEDYSEEIAEDEQLIFVDLDDRPKSEIVRKVKQTRRAVLTAPDPNKLKKNLRSEAKVSTKTRPDVKTASDMAKELLEKRLAMAPKPVKKAPPPRRGRGAKIIPTSNHSAREVLVPDSLTVSELANRMAVRAVDVIRSLMKMGMMAKQDDTIDPDTAELLISEYGHVMVRVTEDAAETAVFHAEDAEDAGELLPRAPVVTIMGHVDHGKTSLLDALRETDVVAGEAGGITQHIGAYQVTMHSGKKITFLDTPGHAAFTAMRARGAKATDIVVLVVAADDGIMEQTKEAISHAKAAEVPIIVAVNKIDKPGADPQRVRTELMHHELVAEEFGGDIMVVDVSALKKLNLDKLEETILLQAEILELKANPNREAAGVVIESRMEKGRGVVSTLLVQKGTLKVGDIVVAGTAFGRVRALTDDKARQHKEALPSMPVEVLGLDEAPAAGEAFAVVENEKTAREVVDYRRDKLLSKQLTRTNAVSLEELFASGGKPAVKELPVIVKGDVHGSVEAITHALQKIDHAEVTVRVLHSGVGAVTESDVALAQTAGASILAFNVRAVTQAKQLAEREKLEIRYYSIIYNLIDDMKAALSGMLSPTLKENFLGYAEIRQVFNITKVGKVAGGFVTQGIIKRGAKCRLLRDNVVIHDGELKTLRRFKDDVKEVRENFECGIAFERYEDIREGDVVEAYEVESITRSV
jgi:translation initiation factor IF-2